MIRTKLITRNTGSHRKKFISRIRKMVSDRLTLSDKKLHAVAKVNGRETEGGARLRKSRKR